MPLPTPAPKPDTLAESHALIEALWAEVNALRPLRDVVSQLEAKVAEQQAQIQELGRVRNFVCEPGWLINRPA